MFIFLLVLEVPNFIFRNAMFWNNSVICYISILALYNYNEHKIFFAVNYWRNIIMCTVLFSVIIPNTDLNRWNIILHFTFLNKRYDKVLS